MVSIHRPLSYEPSTLPLRHAALIIKNCAKKYYILFHKQDFEA